MYNKQLTQACAKICTRPPQHPLASVPWGWAAGMIKKCIFFIWLSTFRQNEHGCETLQCSWLIHSQGGDCLFTCSTILTRGLVGGGGTGREGVTAAAPRSPRSSRRTWISGCTRRAGCSRRTRCPNWWCPPGSSGRPYPAPAADRPSHPESIKIFF